MFNLLRNTSHIPASNIALDDQTTGGILAVDDVGTLLDTHGAQSPQRYVRASWRDHERISERLGVLPRVFTKTDDKVKYFSRFIHLRYRRPQKSRRQQRFQSSHRQAVLSHG